MDKLVFIGGGVATCFSVIELLNRGYPGHKITIIEKGKSAFERKPNETVFGFLGAGGFSDGKVVYSLNQGGELTKYTGEEKGNELIKRTKHLILQFHPEPGTIKINSEPTLPDFIRNSSFTLRKFECWHLGTDYLYEMSKIIQKFLEDNGVNLIFDTTINNIVFENKSIWGEFQNFITSFDRCIIAVGKGGTDLIDRLIKKYNLKTESKSVQIGVRFQSKNIYFEKINNLIYDWKLEKKYGDVGVRSFCVCQNGFICVENVFDGLVSYNGHSYNDVKKRTDKINFGIMLEVPNINDPLQFTLDLVKRCNEGGKAKIYNPNKLQSSIYITIEEFEKIYGEYAMIIIDFINELNKMFGFGNDYELYIPEIKYLTNEVVVDKNDLSIINHPNIYIIGDALSSRGLFVAIGQGLHLSDFLLKKGV